MEQDELLTTLRHYAEESKKAYKIRYSQRDKELANWHDGFHSAIKEVIELIEEKKK